MSPMDPMLFRPRAGDEIAVAANVIVNTQCGSVKPSAVAHRTSIILRGTSAAYWPKIG
jgi:hypothetical protein